jgi:hypothetical protein
LAGDREKATNTLFAVFRSQEKRAGRASSGPPKVKVLVTPCETMQKMYPKEYAKARQDGTCP